MLLGIAACTLFIAKVMTVRRLSSNCVSIQAIRWHSQLMASLLRISASGCFFGCLTRGVGSHHPILACSALHVVLAIVVGLTMPAIAPGVGLIDVTFDQSSGVGHVSIHVDRTVDPLTCSSAFTPWNSPSQRALAVQQVVHEILLVLWQMVELVGSTIVQGPFHTSSMLESHADPLVVILFRSIGVS